MAGKKKKVKKEQVEEEPCPLVVYTTYIGAVPQSLAHCKWLEQTFKTLNVRYKKVDLGKHIEKAQFVRQTSGKRTLPQVFINDLYIGGYEEFVDWNEEGNVYYVLKEMGYTDDIPRAFDKTKEQIEEEQKEYIEKNKEEFEKAREQSLKREKDLEHLQGVRRKYLFQRKQRYYEMLKEEEEKKAQLEREKKQAEINGGGVSLKDRIKSLGISQPQQAQQPPKATARLSNRLDDAGRRVSVLAPVQLGKAPPQQPKETLPTVVETIQVEETLEIDELVIPPQEEVIIHEVPPIIEEEIPIPPEEDIEEPPPVIEEEIPPIVLDDEDIPIPPEEEDDFIPIPPEEEEEFIPIPPEEEEEFIPIPPEEEEIDDIPIPPEEDEPPMPLEDELIDEPPMPFDE